MATVRMADYLQREIVNNFKRLYDKSNPEIKQDTVDADALYETLLSGKVRALEEFMRHQFAGILQLNDVLVETEELTLKTDMMLFDTTYKDGERVICENFENNTEITVPLSTPVWMICKPDSWRGESGVPINANIGNLPGEVAEDARPYIDSIKKKHQDESHRQAKKRIDTDKVEQTLDQFTTLNQALKAWPALSKLVSQEKISKVHEKQQRKRKEQQQRSRIEPIEQNLNKTILTATLLGDD